MSGRSRLREACPLCEAAEAKVLFSARDPSEPARAYEVARCFGCGLVRTRGAPSDYPTTYFSIGWFKRALPGVGASRLRVCRGLSAGRLLDFGSGEGGFVATARSAGWDARGCDPFAPRAEYRSLSEVARADFRPNLVTLWHSLEHVEDPVPVLRDLAGILAPGGAIFVAVPDFASAQSRWGGPDWFHLDVPRHRIHYDRATLEATAGHAGLAFEDRSGPRWEYDPAGWVQTILNRFVPEPNALYRTLKGDPRARMWGLVSFGALPALLPLALLLSARRKDAATIEAVLRPR